MKFSALVVLVLQLFVDDSNSSVLTSATANLKGTVRKHRSSVTSDHVPVSTCTESLPVVTMMRSNSLCL